MPAQLSIAPDVVTHSSLSTSALCEGEDLNFPQVTFVKALRILAWAMLCQALVLTLPLKMWFEQ